MGALGPLVPCVDEDKRCVLCPSMGTNDCFEPLLVPRWSGIRKNVGVPASPRSVVPAGRYARAPSERRRVAGKCFSPEPTVRIHHIAVTDKGKRAAGTGPV